MDSTKRNHDIFSIKSLLGKVNTTWPHQHEQEVVFGQALDWVYIKRKLTAVARKDGVCADMFVQEKPGVANHPLEQDNMDEGIMWLMCVASYVDDDIHERMRAKTVILKRARKAWLRPLCGWERGHKKKRKEKLRRKLLVSPKANASLEYLNHNKGALILCRVWENNKIYYIIITRDIIAYT